MHVIEVSDGGVVVDKSVWSASVIIKDKVAAFGCCAMCSECACRLILL